MRTNALDFIGPLNEMQPSTPMYQIPILPTFVGWALRLEFVFGWEPGVLFTISMICFHSSFGSEAMHMYRCTPA